MRAPNFATRSLQMFRRGKITCNCKTSSMLFSASSAVQGMMAWSILDSSISWAI